MEEEWVSITEAAQRLTASGDFVDRSTLSRYLKQHAEALTLRPEGKANLVDFNALAAHRSENIRIRSVGPGPQHRLTRAAAAKRFPSQADGAARKAQADAEMRELDLAERRRQLTPTVEVDRAARDAVALMQSAYDRAVENEAAVNSVRYGWDERVVRIALKAFARKGLEVFHTTLLERMDVRVREALAGDDMPSAETPAGLQ